MSSSSSYCQLEVNSLDGRKVIFEQISATDTSIEDVFGMVQTVEEPGSQWKLMAVVSGRLVPLHWAERDRKLSDVGLQGNDERYRIEVCLAWAELKKVLT